MKLLRFKTSILSDVWGLENKAQGSGETTCEAKFQQRLKVMEADDRETAKQKTETQSNSSIPVLIRD